METELNMMAFIYISSLCNFFSLLLSIGFCIVGHTQRHPSSYLSTNSVSGSSCTSSCSLGAGKKKKDSYYMDKKASGKEISEEVTRESLIAISYSEPEKDLSIESEPENSNRENVVKSINEDEDNKYRSELISISYEEPPDTEVEQVSPGEFKG
ncbi:PREDICTED: uncharacterized protein LOC109238003 [Nicotiana attenuata]|uniref:uncharacterized protein LOC109238003 n=1 Tax=Nicotiana attenuata TaxID=49451 RepID=UPI000904C298|nr:PREDICTED: uncharacterized protein LOC109238003 [Nicotiana attenuata]